MTFPDDMICNIGECKPTSGCLHVHSCNQSDKYIPCRLPQHVRLGDVEYPALFAQQAVTASRVRGCLFLQATASRLQETQKEVAESSEKLKSAAAEHLTAHNAAAQQRATIENSLAEARI